MNRSSNPSCTWGMVHTKIHLISQDNLWPKKTVQCRQNRGLIHHSFIFIHSKRRPTHPSLCCSFCRSSKSLWMTLRTCSHSSSERWSRLSFRPMVYESQLRGGRATSLWGGLKYKGNKNIIHQLITTSDVIITVFLFVITWGREKIS